MCKVLEDLFPAPWDMREHPEKTEGWLEFQREARKAPDYYKILSSSVWISVKDRLPHRRQRVVVSSEDGYDMAVLFYFGKDEDDLLEWSVIETIDPVDISYWMPLPEPPKE